MTKLLCRMCGGTLVMDASWDFAECEQCGLKYTKDSIQKMMLDFQTADSKPSVAEQYLMKAGLMLETGDCAGARGTYQQVLDRIDPLSSEAWWGLLRCRFRLAELLLSERLNDVDVRFLFDGKPEWDMSAFRDNLNNAFLHATPEQRIAYEREYTTFMEALPEKRRMWEESKGRDLLQRDLDSLRKDMDRLQTLRTEREASLKSAKRRRIFRILWLVLALAGTLSTLHITYRLLTNTQSFSALLFEFIVSIFIMVVFWMIFSFNKSVDLKKSRLAYFNNSISELTNQINDTESRMNSLKSRLNQLP